VELRGCQYFKTEFVIATFTIRIKMTHVYYINNNVGRIPIRIPTTYYSGYIIKFQKKSSIIICTEHS